MCLDDDLKELLDETPYITESWAEFWCQCPCCDEIQRIQERLFKNGVSQVVNCTRCKSKVMVTK